jgi:hypothetical protein
VPGPGEVIIAVTVADVLLALETRSAVGKTLLTVA